MQYCGYSLKFRYVVVTSALNAYDSIKLQVQNGERPLYRPYRWGRERRDQQKKLKPLEWYTKGGYALVIFVPSTSGSELQRWYQDEINQGKARAKKRVYLTKLRALDVRRGRFGHSTSVKRKKRVYQRIQAHSRFRWKNDGVCHVAALQRETQWRDPGLPDGYYRSLS